MRNLDLKASGLVVADGGDGAGVDDVSVGGPLEGGEGALTSGTTFVMRNGYFLP